MQSLRRDARQRPSSGARRRLARNRGFTLVELMIVAAILGVLAALAIYGIRSYIASARTTEAKASVGAISQLATGVFERERAEAELINADIGGSSVAAQNYLCNSASVVPAVVPAGNRYQPSNQPGSDFHTGSSSDGWACLGFTMTTPIYYQYSYFKSSGYVSPNLGGPDPGSDGFEAAATGDLDGDNVHSTFARTGIIVGKRLRVATQIFIDDEFE